MDEPYITVTLEVAGYDDEVMTKLHDDLRDILQAWVHALSYGEVNITYQDQGQIERDAQVEAEAEEDTWYEG